MSGSLYFGDYYNQKTSPYGNILSRGGLGGRGAGAVYIKSRHVVVDGVLSADGEAGPSVSTAGGGSGGSVWIDCEELDGYGRG